MEPSAPEPVPWFPPDGGQPFRRKTLNPDSLLPKPGRLMRQRPCRIRVSNKTRPNGQAESSPGLKPKADALGKRAESPSDLKGRKNPGLIEPKRRAELSRPYRPPWFFVPFPPRASACGLGPWAGFCRPVGPVLLETLSAPGLRERRSGFAPPGPEASLYSASIHCRPFGA